MTDILNDKYPLSGNLSQAKNDIDEFEEYIMNSRCSNPQDVDDKVQIPFSEINGEDIKRAIRNLPHEFRFIVMLYLLGNFSYAEISDIASINLETVRSRLH